MRSLRQRLQRIGVVASGLVLAALAAAGGDGLVRHGSFEAADAQGQPVGWSIERRAEVEGRAELVPQARHGRQALHLVHANDKGLWVRASQDHIQARPGARLRFSGWVKAEGTWEVWLYEFLPDGTYKTIVLARGQRTDWQRLRQVVTLGPETRRLKLSLIARPRSEAWFDDMRLDDLDGPARLRVPLLAAAPALDGDLTDAAWSGAAVVDDFLRLGGAGEPASQATRVRLGVADGRLWVAWECSEDRLDEQRLSAAPGWGDDTVEVFLGEPGQAALHHLGVTPAGAALSQVIEPEGGTAYAIDWFSSQTRRDSAAPPELLPCVGAARRGEGRWTAEMAIDLRGRGRPGATWRLQLARSRKVADLEENSTWTLTPGERFLQSERFGHVVMASPIAAPSPERLVAAPPFEAPRQARVVPAPRQCRWTGADPLALAGRVRVASRGVATAAARDLLERVLSQDLGLAVERVEAPLEAIEQHAPALGILKRLVGRDLGRVVERLEGSAEVVILQGPLDLPKGLADWQREEAYALDVDARGIRIRAEGRRGALYGVQTLRQMLTRHDGRLHIPAAAILDWPVMRWRGWHVTGPDTSAAVPEAGRVIDLMAALKFNWIAIQIDSRLRYERHPALSRGPDAPTKDELRSLVLQAQALGMEVIPMTQCWSHFNYFLEKEEFRHLAEIPHPPESAKRRFWNYCPRHPETHTMLFGMIEEQLECFPGATVFHVGLDEITFEPIGQCERCRGSTGGELLAEEIGRLHAFVTGKGLRLAMWGDQLLLSHNGKYFQTAEALPKVPRDVILFDWHYNAADEFPSVPFFKNEGFEVVACGWYEPGNIAGLCAEAHRQGILGYGGTTWYSIAALRREVRLTTALPLSAEAMASAQPLDLAALPYRPAEVFQDLREPPDGRTASFLPVDLRGWANRRLSDRPERPGWLGLGPQHDLAALPTGRQWWCGVPFDILPGDGDQCLVLASSEDADGALPEEAWAIPVGTAADALVFLHTGSRPARFSRHIYDRAGINPGLIGRIVVRYDDGQTVEEELRWNVTLADWNSQLGSACGRSAWTGTTAGGALARVEALTWRNPHPEKAIASFDLVSARSTVRPVLLAVTARLPAP